MPPPRPRRIAVLVAGLALSGAGLAEVDPVQLGLLRQYTQPLRWDSVDRHLADGSPYWRGGEAPGADADGRGPRVRLEPGQQITVFVPAGETLRVLGRDAPLATDALRVSFTQDARLFVGQTPQRSTDGRSWLLPAPVLTPVLARVSRPLGAATGLDIGVFVSRREAMPVIAPYRKFLPLPLAEVDLRPGNDAAGQRYWRLPAGQVVRIALRGPKRLALAARLHYPPGEARSGLAWTVRWRLDDAPLPAWQAGTGAETAVPVFVDGVETPVSREKEGYVEIPAGEHTLSLDASAPLLARLLEQEDGDYLLPALNEPLVAARQVRSHEPPLRLKPSIWLQSAEETLRPLRSTDADAAELRQAALRLVADNRLRKGGLVAARALLNTGERRRDDPTVRAEAIETHSLHTFYRDLLPARRSSRGEVRFAWFIVPRLPAVGERERGLAVFAQHADDLLGAIESGWFVPLADAAAPQAYKLPEQAADGWLRVAAQAEPVGTDPPQALYLQYDAEPPRRLELGPAALADDAFAPSLAEAGLLVDTLEHGAFGGSTLSAAFSRTRPPAELIRAGVFDFELPRGVREVRVWRADGAGGRVRVALKVRAGRLWQLDQAGFLEAVRRTGEETTLPRFVQALAGAPPDRNEIAAAELDSHWQPLARLIRSQARTFFAGVAPARTLPRAPGSPAAALAAGNALARTGHWLPALEAWSDARQHADGSEAAAIDRRRIEALEQLGEDFLAEQWLRQRLRDDPEPTLREEARAWLERRARRDDDREALLALAATAVQLRPEPDNLGRLAEALSLNDESALALQASLLLPPARRDPELLLHASLRLGWWQVFEATLAALPGNERRAFWRGQRELLAGQRDAALRQWQTGDAEALAYARHSEAALALRQRLLASRDAAVIADWAQWQATHPGPWQWRESPDLVVDAAGSEALYAIDRDLFALGWRATPERPVRARFFGPLHLRVEGRPLHAAGAKLPIDGWLRVRAPGQLWVTPISNNVPAPGLAFVGNPQELPGRKEVREIAFGPGLHEIEIDGERQPLLVRVSARRPALPIGLLPLLTPETAASPAPAIDPGEALPNWSGCPDCIAVVPAPAAGDGPAATYHRPAVRTLTTAAVERFDPPPPPPLAASRDPLAERVAAGRWDELLALPATGDADALRDRLGLYLWVAEHHPEQYARFLAAGSALAGAHPEVGGLGALLDRLARESGWVPLASVESSRGLRAVEIDRWQPESPALRTRRALLAPLQPEEQVVSGGNHLVLALFNPAPTTLRLRLAGEDLPAQQPATMNVAIHVDDRLWKRIRLPTEAPAQTLEVPLAGGRHAIRIGIEQPFANQFLRVRFADRGRHEPPARVERFYQAATAASPLRVRLPGPQWLRIDELRDGRILPSYRHLDRDWQEVVLAPADGRGEALYRLHLRTPLPDLPDIPPRPVAVVPEPVPLPEVRIDAPMRSPEVRLADALDLAGQADGTWSFGLAYRHRPYSFDNPRFRDGVESSIAAAVAANPGLAGAAARTRDYFLARPAEKYLEANATWRYFDAELHHYREATILGRWREAGGPSAGLKGRIDWMPVWATWTASLEGSAYAQSPGGEALDVAPALGVFGMPTTAPGFRYQRNSLEWSAELRGSLRQLRPIDPKTYHLPELIAFIRRSSLQGQPFPPYSLGKLDQDVHTPYRSEHERGIEIADTLIHRPWLDTLWYAGISLTTNENFALNRPDHIAGKLGWRQLLGPAWIDVRWNHTRYLADDLRKQAVNSRQLAIEGGGEVWHGPWHRFELRLSLQRDFDRRDTSAGVELVWHTGNGRGFRDFRPGDIDFRDLRERRRPADPNPRVEDARQ